mmetsp:Transcript_104829/g.313177  ORF Transcript_104829/g.313177 Transcript_104829/m.313177 type:complete len:227 (-) Transcript_104829:430-1110(-)
MERTRRPRMAWSSRSHSASSSLGLCPRTRSPASPHRRRRHGLLGRPAMTARGTCPGATAAACRRQRTALGRAWRPRQTARTWRPRRRCPWSRPTRARRRGRCKTSRADPTRRTRRCRHTWHPPPSVPPAPRSSQLLRRPAGTGPTAAVGGASAPSGYRHARVRSLRPTTSSSSTLACGRAGGRHPFSSQRSRRPSRLQRRWWLWCGPGWTQSAAACWCCGRSRAPP